MRDVCVVIIRDVGTLATFNLNFERRTKLDRYLPTLDSFTCLSSESYDYPIMR